MERKFFNKNLEFVGSNWKGNCCLGKEFVDLVSLDRSDVKKMAIGALSRLLFRFENKEIPVQYSSKLDLKDCGDCIVWLGHSSFLISVGGVRIVTDFCFF